MKKEQFRNWLHYLIGAVIGMLLFQTFDGVPFPIQLFLTTFVMGVIGGMWEWGWNMYNGSEIDYYDMFRGVAGALTSLIILEIWVN